MRHVNVETPHTNVETPRGVSLPCNQLANRFGTMKPGSLQSVMNHFKGAVTRWCNQNGYNDFAWQPLFDERRIRSIHHLNIVREYIRNNPNAWVNANV